MTTEDSDKTRTSSDLIDLISEWVIKHYRSIIEGFIAIIIVAAVAPFGVSAFLQTCKQCWGWNLEPNQIGDSFGLLNALMSSVAAFAVAFAIYLQIQERRDSEKRQREMIAMQLCQTYLSSISNIATIDKNSHDDADYELRLFLLRMQGIAYKFLQSQPAHVLFFKDFLGAFGKQARSCLDDNRSDEAIHFVIRSARHLVLWMPKIQSSERDAEKEMVEFVNAYYKPLCREMGKWSSGRSDNTSVRKLLDEFDDKFGGLSLSSAEMFMKLDISQYE